MINLSLECMNVPSIPMCACIGYFDGMHRGHQELIKETIKMAQEKNCEAALITFDPDPWVTIKGLQNVKHITTIRERINKAVALGIQNIVVLKFTKEMSQLAPEDFVSKVLGKLNLQGLVCGFDFHYGLMGKGSAETLKNSVSYEVHIIGEVDDNLGKISSTRISECIVNGDMEQVAEMMGTYYSIEGLVVHGRRMGTDIGFPTANVSYSDEYLLPKPGVYACIAHVGGRTYRAMVNLGHNPTFNYRQELSLEAYLLDFSGDLYEHSIRLDFIHFIRDEMAFHNKDNLILQLEQDAHTVRKLLANI
jgi:riboflavin kinase/FMN adenylyltransferase